MQPLCTRRAGDAGADHRGGRPGPCGPVQPAPQDQHLHQLHPGRLPAHPHQRERAVGLSRALENPKHPEHPEHPKHPHQRERAVEGGAVFATPLKLVSATPLKPCPQPNVCTMPMPLGRKTLKKTCKKPENPSTTTPVLCCAVPAGRGV